MKIAVLIKRVPDTASVFTVAADGKSVDTASLKYVMSPYDEHAVEEAIRLKEKLGAEVIVISAGPPDTKETLRSALAMGADSAVLLTGGDHLAHRGLAKALAAVLKGIAPDLILAGKQAVDDDASQVPERVAELLEIPHASVITRLGLEGTVANVDREIEGGAYTLEMALPPCSPRRRALTRRVIPPCPIS